MRLVGWIARSIWTTLAATLVLAAVAIWIGVRMDLTRTGAVGLYFVVWWTVLFAILPVRINSQAEAGEVVAGTEPGAPANPALFERVIWTTIAAGLVFCVVALLFPLAGL
jgi:predicted secreted protein